MEPTEQSEAQAASTLRAFFDATGALIRQHDPQHLITAGLEGDGDGEGGGDGGWAKSRWRLAVRAGAAMAVPVACLLWDKLRRR